MRRALASLLALLSCGCVAVGSDEPLFSAADAAPPQLRPGVWAMPNDKCDFDEDAPVRDWPSCANPNIVGNGVITGGFGDKDGPQALPFVLAGGDPPVLQIRAPADKKPDEPNYLYAGLRPLELDDEGRIIAASAWLAFCFVPPLKPDAPQPKPFPGLTMKQGDSFCRASRPEPVRNAVRRSETLEMQGETLQLTARWIRDGER